MTINIQAPGGSPVAATATDLQNIRSGLGVRTYLGAFTTAQIAALNAALAAGTAPAYDAGTTLINSDTNVPYSLSGLSTAAAFAATTAASIGLGNVNNTSDVNKPVSTAQAAADAAVLSAAQTFATTADNTLHTTITGETTTAIANSKPLTTAQVTAGATAPVGTNSGGVLLKPDGTTLTISAKVSNIWRKETYFCAPPGPPLVDSSSTGLAVSSFTASLSANVLTVTTTVTGAALVIGSHIEGPGVPGGVFITALTGTGTGQAGTYPVSGAAVTVASTTMWTDGGAGTTFTTDLNNTRGWKVLRRASRFRLWFSTGSEHQALTGFTLKGFVQVPSKGSTSGGVAIEYLPITIGTNSAYSVPAGGGVLFASDWLSWPVDIGDAIHSKVFITNGGNPFTISGNHSPYTTAGRNASGLAEMAFANVGADRSGQVYGSSPWTVGTGALSGGSWNAVFIETDSDITGRLPTIDHWGDSIGYGAGASSLTSFLDTICTDAGVPFLNLCIAGQSQGHIPWLAKQRMKIAKGEITICEHGRNSSSTADLLALWKYLRNMGYKKIIQTSTTNATNTGNTAITGDSSSMRTYIMSQLGVGDGPDAILDVFAAAQDPTTGLWLNSAWTADGTHPNDTGNTAITTYLETSNGIIIPGGTKMSFASYIATLA